MKTLTVSYNNGTWEVDDKSRPGFPPVGRGSTLKEAIGDYVCNNIDSFDITLDFTKKALFIHVNLVNKELKKR